MQHLFSSAIVLLLPLTILACQKQNKSKLPCDSGKPCTETKEIVSAPIPVVKAHLADLIPHFVITPADKVGNIRLKYAAGKAQFKPQWDEKRQALMLAELTLPFDLTFELGEQLCTSEWPELSSDISSQTPVCQ